MAAYCFCTSQVVGYKLFHLRICLLWVTHNKRYIIISSFFCFYLRGRRYEFPNILHWFRCLYPFLVRRSCKIVATFIFPDIIFRCSPSHSRFQLLRLLASFTNGERWRKTWNNFTKNKNTKLFFCCIRVGSVEIYDDYYLIICVGLSQLFKSFSKRLWRVIHHVCIIVH